MTASIPRPATEIVDDTAILPLDIAGFEELELPHRIAATWFCRAARAGDRLTFAQGSRHHLPMMQVLEGIVVARPRLPGDLLERITLYLKQLWLHRGNHHFESSLKFLPPFSSRELIRACRTAGLTSAAESLIRRSGGRRSSLWRAFFDPEFEVQVTCKSPPAGKDVVTASTVSFYEGVTAAEVGEFPGHHPLNSTLVRRNGRIEEEVWRAGGEEFPPGRFAGPLAEVAACLENALPHLSEAQASYFRWLIRWFRTGRLEDFDAYNRAWVRTEAPVDIIIGFIETYADPLGHRGSFEGAVHMPERDRARLMRTLAREAAWFEARMPWDPRYSRTHIEPAQADVSSVLTLTGSAAPFGYAGVNLPNAAYLREEVGSRSFMVDNVQRQRRRVAGDAYLRALCLTEAELERAKRCSEEAMDLIVALHEVVGHASGRLDPALDGEPEEHLREYYNTLEETRADLVAMWHIFDPRLVELGLMSSLEVAEEAMWHLLRGVLVTISRMDAPFAEEDHDRGDLLIAHFLLDRGAGVRQVTHEGRTHLVVTDLQAMRQGIGELLAELMRIKGQGDYEAIRALVERYGVRVDPALHAEMRARAAKFGVPARVAFINPELELVRDSQGRIIDVEVRYPASFEEEQLKLSSFYRSLQA